jgi:hypothetical protein
VRAGAAGEEAEAVGMPSSCGPNESVTPASNQQIIPALAPQSSTPFSRRRRGGRALGREGRAVERDLVRPARVLLQDFTGVPAVVDLAAMRDAMADLGGDPREDQPAVPAELVIDHSVQVDEFGTSARAFGATPSSSSSATASAIVPALGPAGVRATSRSCRRTPASATR